MQSSGDILIRSVSSIMIVLSLSGLICNGLIISAFIRRPHRVLKRRAQLFLLHLSIADMFLSMAALGHSIVTSPLVHDNSTCTGGPVVVNVLTRVSFVLLVLIGLDRYLAILLPLQYTTLVKTRLRVHLQCVVAWIIPVFMHTPFLIIFNTNAGYRDFMCSKAPDLTKPYPPLVAGYYWCHVVWLPFLTIILSFFYLNILLEIRRMKTRFPLMARKHSSVNKQNKHEFSLEKSTFSQSPGSSRSSRKVSLSSLNEIQYYGYSYNRRQADQLLNKLHIVSPSSNNIRQSSDPSSELQDIPSNCSKRNGTENAGSVDKKNGTATLSNVHLTNNINNVLTKNCISTIKSSLRHPFENSKLTVKKLEIDNKTLTVSYDLCSLEKAVPQYVSKVEINVYTEDNVKLDPVIDLNSSAETLGRCINKTRCRRMSENSSQSRASKEFNRRMTDPVNYPVYRENNSSVSDEVEVCSAISGSRRSSFSALKASFSDLRKISASALSQASTQLTKMARLKGSLTIALIFIAAVVGYSPRFSASVLELLQIHVPYQLSIASNIAIAFWPISNAFIYCFRNKEIFGVVFGIGKDRKSDRKYLNTWPPLVS